MEIKEIIVPENWEVFIEDGVATFKEKKLLHPRSWEKFCENYPRTKDEYFISNDSSINQVFNTDKPRNATADKNICISKEEAEAFLALMQLRQLRKAWVGGWEPLVGKETFGVIHPLNNELRVATNLSCGRSLYFPTCEIAEDFLNCFRDLCETAKILL